MKRIIILLMITALGLGVAYLAGIGGKSYAGWPVVFICAFWAYLLNWLAFVPAALFKTEKYYDLTGSLTYLSMIGLALYLTQPVDLRATVVAILVGIWAIRLGSFLFNRIRRDHGDHRFDKIKTIPLRFLITWTLQGCWVVFTAICALAIIATDTPKDWGGLATVGLVIWLLGFAIEVIADAQKSKFKKDPANKGTFITSGLWGRSQHPNYLGEITLWFGIAIIALPILAGWQYIALISPVFVALLLTKVSGIPLLRKSSEARWGDDPKFQEYRKSTPVLIPKLFRQ